MTPDDLIAELDRSLHGPARTKRRLLTDAAGGLQDAVLAYRAAGIDGPRANALALADFGTVDHLSAHFQRELDITRARRYAVTSMVAAPLLVGLWKAGWELNPHHPHQVALPALLIALAACLLSAVTCLAGVAAYLATGRLSRRWAWTGTVRVLRLCTRLEVAAVGVSMATLWFIAPAMFSWSLVPVLIMTTATTMTMVSQSRGADTTRAVG